MNKTVIPVKVQRRSLNLLDLLNHVKDNVTDYNITFVNKVMDYTDEYIRKYRQDIETDCWITGRMLFNVFNQGNIQVNFTLYHIENPFFIGYHDFIVCYEKYDGPWYLCDSWCGKYVMKIFEVDNTFETLLRDLKNSDLLKRQTLFTDLFGYSSINPEVNPEDIRITSVRFKVYYNTDTVMRYKDIVPNKTTILNLQSM
jgi:hypothetical protein